MKKIAEAVVAINHYTGTDAENAMIIDRCLPIMGINARQYKRRHPLLIIEIEDLIAYQQMYLLYWLKYEHKNATKEMNQKFLTLLLYRKMIDLIRADYKDYRHFDQYCEFVQQLALDKRNEYHGSELISDLRITINELNVSHRIKDVLFKLLIDQYAPADVLNYYGVSWSRITQLFDEGMTALCHQLNLESKRHYIAPFGKTIFHRFPEGKYVDPTVPLIIQDYRLGMSYYQLSIKYQKARITIKNLIDKYGVEIPHYEDSSPRKAA